MSRKVLLFALLMSLFSCKSYDVLPGAERVRVFETEPKNCIYVGEVSSIQEDETVGTLETEMDLATRIELRNKAHKLGGNIIVFLKGRNTNTLPSTASVTAPTKAGAAKSGGEAKAEESVPASSENRTLIFLATVFRCPSSILNQ